MDNSDAKTLRVTVDQLKNKLGSAIVVLASTSADKVSLVTGVTQDQTNKISASELADFVAQQVGGKGGGRPDMAQAGGNRPAELGKALESAHKWISERLS